MRPRRYTKRLLKQVEELHLDGCTGVEISKRLDVPTSSISMFKSANFDLDTYLQNNLDNTRFFRKNKFDKTVDILLRFQIFLNKKGLINDYDFDYKKEAIKFLKIEL